MTSVAIRLHLSAHPLHAEDHDKCEAAYGLLILDKSLIEQLLAQAPIFWQKFKAGGGLCQVPKINWPLTFFKGSYYTEPHEFTGTKTFPTRGLREAPLELLSAHGVLRCTACQLYLGDVAPIDQSKKVEYFWVARVEATGVEIRTAAVNEDVLRAMLDRLS